jgi:gamma-glutamyltranspeptidase/glutathione hydrolase
MAARRRGALRGPHSCVAADHPLAARAGAATLDRGGTAADAAIAMAAVMTVVQPNYSQLGGDLFAMTFDATTCDVRALNSSGPAPAAATPSLYARAGGIPSTGALAVTVPGCVDGWWRLHEEYGRLPWASLFESAVGYAREGFPVSRQLAGFIAGGLDRPGMPDAWTRAFGGAHEGGVLRQPDLAATMFAIAEQGPAAFYQGAIAAACVTELASGGAPFTSEDWRGPGRWEAPVSTLFAGACVWTQPPPSQGFVLTLGLRLYEELLASGAGVADCVLQHAALASAFALRAEQAGDPDHVPFDAQSVVDRATLAGRSLESAGVMDGDTTYLLAIDRAGNAVSLIQSLFHSWGSGVMVPGTGIIMNSRMTGFTLREGHPNTLLGGKRPMHTLHSFLVTGSDGRLRMVGGTPGAMQQPLTNLFAIDGVVRRGEDIQDVLDAPRWSMGAFALAEGHREVLVESHTADRLAPAFRDAGVGVKPVPSWHPSLGRAYVAVLDESGIAAGADPRGEGLAIVG